MQENKIYFYSDKKIQKILYKLKLQIPDLILGKIQYLKNCKIKTPKNH